jgi:WD40 repeat protein
MAVSPDGKALAIRCEDGLHVLDLATGRKRAVSLERVVVRQTPRGAAEARRYDDKTRGAAFSPDGKLLAAWGFYGLKFFDAPDDYKLVRSNLIKSSSDISPSCLAFSLDSKMYATGDSLGKLTLFDSATGNTLRSVILAGDGSTPHAFVPAQ